MSQGRTSFLLIQKLFNHTDRRMLIISILSDDTWNLGRYFLCWVLRVGLRLQNVATADISFLEVRGEFPLSRFPLDRRGKLCSCILEALDTLTCTYVGVYNMLGITRSLGSMDIILAKILRLNWADRWSFLFEPGLEDNVVGAELLEGGLLHVLILLIQVVVVLWIGVGLGDRTALIAVNPCWLLVLIMVSQETRVSRLHLLGVFGVGNAEHCVGFAAVLCYYFYSICSIWFKYIAL